MKIRSPNRKDTDENERHVDMRSHSDFSLSREGGGRTARENQNRKQQQQKDQRDKMNYT